MAIQLGKGQTVDLTKDRKELSRITVGLSWGKAVEVVEVKESVGLLGALFGKTPKTKMVTRELEDMDIDSSVVLASGKRKYDLVYYGNLRGAGVNHKGDDLTGSDKKGEYDNEEIEIDLNRVPSNVDRLIFVANIYRGEERGQHFGQVSKGAYIRVLNSSNREELIRYELSQEFDKLRGIVVGELYRYNGDWKFKAIGQGTPKSNLTNLVDLSL